MFHHHYLLSLWIFFLTQFGRYFLRFFTFDYRHKSFFSDEIAFCMEKSYRQVSVNEAARILYLNNQKELEEIAKNVNNTSIYVKLTKFYLSFSMDGN